MANYTEQQAAERLGGALAAWSVADGHLRRHVSCNGWRASMLIANGIAHVAEMTWHHPDLHISWGGVDIALRTHSEDAISDKDFELAALIEQWLGWRPAADGALEGAPTEGQWRYLSDA
ncbi:MAG: 4a-hydroxytetrahydrobiopterin dehydratase [Gammaproteobacteria bacterium]|nr:4a-hydroxytetrahydrobiopterin dehydratase [Gammaproteobacteria bacterium]